jgi:hypothetical protein
MRRRWRLLGSLLLLHQGGWDEVLLIFGVPVVLFALLRWLGVRRERREAAAQDSEPEDPGTS